MTEYAGEIPMQGFSLPVTLFFQQKKLILQLY